MTGRLLHLQDSVYKKVAAPPQSSKAGRHACAEAAESATRKTRRDQQGSLNGAAKKVAHDEAVGVVLTKCHRGILRALAQYRQSGRSVPQIALLAGYSQSGTFSGALADLRKIGYITTGHPVRITEEGLHSLGDDWEPLPEGRGLIDHWLNKLSKCGAAILRHLVEVYPAHESTESLAAATGYRTSGTFAGELAELRALELIDRGKEIRASKELFA